MWAVNLDTDRKGMRIKGIREREMVAMDGGEEREMSVLHLLGLALREPFDPERTATEVHQVPRGASRDPFCLTSDVPCCDWKADLARV